MCIYVICTCIYIFSYQSMFLCENVGISLKSEVFKMNFLSKYKILHSCKRSINVKQK